MKRYRSLITISLMTAALVSITALTVLAGSRPFRLVEHGKVTVTPHDTTGTTLDLVADGIGTATHLGLITVHREAILTPTSAPSVFDVKGEATLTAANGEQLRSSFTGTLDASVGHADLIYEWTGGSKGRFENATGATTWSIDVANGEYDAVADGQINF